MGGSFKIGRVWGIDVKLHSFFLLWIVYRFLSAKAGQHQEVFIEEAVLLVSVFLHELGHCAGARWMKGEAKEVILWPLGGLTLMRTPNTAKAEFVSTAAGPLVNLLICTVGGALALLTGLTLKTLQEGATPATLVLFYVVIWNGVLFLFNVLPAYPMDGGRILRSVLWPIAGWRTATLIATVTAMVFGAGFVGIAILFGAAGIFFALIGVMVFMASYREFQRARAFRLLPTVEDDRMPHEHK